LASPPEKITMRRPLKAPWITWATRSASVSVFTPAFSIALCAASISTCALGGLILMMCAPSWAAIWAA
jgi:hypothetical protein